MYTKAVNGWTNDAVQTLIRLLMEEDIWQVKMVTCRDKFSLTLVQMAQLKVQENLKKLTGLLIGGKNTAGLIGAPATCLISFGMICII